MKFTWDEKTKDLTSKQKMLLDYSILFLEGESSEFDKKDFMAFYNINEDYPTEEISKDVSALMKLSNYFEEKMKNGRWHVESIKLFLRVSYNKGIINFKWNEDLLISVVNKKKKMIKAIQEN